MFKTILLLSICVILCLSQDNSTQNTNPDDTSTAAAITTNEQHASTETSDLSQNSTQNTNPDNTSTAASITTSEQQASTESSTSSQAPSTPTTTTPSKADKLNFTLPKNSQNYTYLKLELALTMSISYKALVDNKETTKTLKFDLPSNYDNYDGDFDGKELISLFVDFWKSWTVTMNYTLSDSKYQLSAVSLDYDIDNVRFPDATKESLGMHRSIAKNLKEFQANKGSSYKCSSETTINLDNSVQFIVSKYQAEPFYGKPNGEFDTAVDCPADTKNTNKLVPIIVGAALAFLVVLVLIAYLIGRRRHSPGYKSI